MQNISEKQSIGHQKLLEFVVSFIPKSLLDDDLEKIRSYTIIGYCGLNLLFVFMFLPILLLLRLDLVYSAAGLGILLACALSVPASLKVLKNTESTILAGNTCILMQFIIIFTSIYISGGMGGSPINLFFIMVPVLAFVMAGLYSGLFWAALVIFLQTFGVYSEHSAGNAPIQLFDQRSIESFEIMSAPIMLLIIALAVSASEMVNKQLTEKLYKERNRFSFKATHDALTGLANRNELTSCLSIAVKTSRLNKSKLSTLIYIDLDGFKPINDSLGHHYGDEVLKIIAKRLQSVIRNSDFVARFGGDEFAVVLTGAASRADLIPVLDKMLSVLNDPIILEGQEVSVSGSLGVSVCPEDAEDEYQMTRQADIALYAAKQTKNCYVFFRDVDPQKSSNISPITE